MNKILIDLTSIKKNPDYGYGAGYKRFVPGSWIAYFTCQGELPSQFTPENIRFTGLFTDPNYHEGIITNPAAIDLELLEKEIKEKGLYFTISYEREMFDVSTKMEPEYFFDYVPTMVKCYMCGAEFLHTELESDDFYDGEEDNYTNEQCPNCGAWDCLDGEWEFEDLQDALKKKEVLEASEFTIDTISKITGVPKKFFTDERDHDGC